MWPFLGHGSGMASFKAWPELSPIGMAATMPNIDIVDNGGSFSIKADIPGLEKKNIKLTVTENYLVISARKTGEKEAKGKNYYSHERSSVGFYREMALPEGVKSETARAKYENGILIVEVKKINPTRPRGRDVKID